MKKEDTHQVMKFTVFEHIERGTRFLTSYCPENKQKKLKIIGHTETIEEAQAICEERSGLNWGYFFKDMNDTMLNNL